MYIELFLAALSFSGTWQGLTFHSLVWRNYLLFYTVFSGLYDRYYELSWFDILLGLVILERVTGLWQFSQLVV